MNGLPFMFAGDAISRILGGYQQQRAINEKERTRQAERAQDIGFKERALERRYPTMKEKATEIGGLGQDELANLLMLEGRKSPEQMKAELARTNAQTEYYGAGTNYRNTQTRGMQDEPFEDFINSVDNPKYEDEIQKDEEFFNGYSPDQQRELLPGLEDAKNPEGYIKDLAEAYRLAQRRGDSALASAIRHAARQRGQILQEFQTGKRTGTYDFLQDLLEGLNR